MKKLSLLAISGAHWWPVLLGLAALSIACSNSDTTGNDQTSTTGAGGSGGAGGGAGGTIGEPPQVSVLDAHPVLSETEALVHVTLSHQWVEAITVQFDTADGTAIGDPGGNGDYVPVSQQVTLPAGTTDATVPIKVKTPYQTLTLETALSRFFATKLSNPGGGATLADAEGVVTLAQAGMVIETPLAGGLAEADHLPDFNGDQKPDLVLSGSTGSAAILLTPGTTFEEAGHVVLSAPYLDGAKAFSYPVNVSLGGQEYCFADHGQGADVNGDGLSDVLVAGEGTTHILYGQTGTVDNFTSGDPRFSDGVHGTEMADLAFVGYGVGPIQTGDWNADGIVDWAQAHFYSSVAGGTELFKGFYGEPPPLGAVFNASLAFSFQSGTQPVGVGSLFNGTYTGGRTDLNGDGIDDIVFVGLAANDGQFGGNYLYVRFGDGQTFTGQSAPVKGTLDGTNGFEVSNNAYPPSFAPQDSGDVNGDGIEDLVLTGGGYPLTVIFGRTTPYASGAYALLSDMGIEAAFFNTEPVRSARIGDMNRDGIGDIVFITENKLRVVWGSQDLEGKDIFGTQYPEVGEIDIDPASGLDRVSIVGDFDGDNAADVVILSDSWNSNTGGALMLFGNTLTRFLGGPDLPPPR